MKMSKADLVSMVGEERAKGLLEGALPAAGKASGKMRLPDKPEMTKPEEAYFNVLAIEFRPTEFFRIEFETVKLRLNSGTLYTPDFTVWHERTLLLLVEVKGKIKLKSIDRATLKFKEAITSFPHLTFRHAFQDGLGGWGVQQKCYNDPKK